jgi:hypothetical protein
MKDRVDIIKYASIIAITLGIIVIFFFININQEYYSIIYIKPNSTIYTPNDHNLTFEYGVKSFENGKSNYNLTIYSGIIKLKNKQFSLNKGETLEENIKISLPPETKFPDKISLMLNHGNFTEEVHFWLR